MSLISIADARLHIGTDLPDDALQAIIDAEEALIVQGYGPHTTQTDVMFTRKLTSTIMLKRSAQSITSIIERWYTVDYTLAPEDYELIDNGNIVHRLVNSPFGKFTWGDLVTITYTPLDESALRVGVLIDLVKTNIQHTGANIEKDTDYTIDTKDYVIRKGLILNQLRHRVVS